MTASSVPKPHRPYQLSPDIASGKNTDLKWIALPIMTPRITQQNQIEGSANTTIPARPRPPPACNPSLVLSLLRRILILLYTKLNGGLLQEVYRKSSPLLRDGARMVHGLGPSWGDRSIYKQFDPWPLVFLLDGEMRGGLTLAFRSPLVPVTPGQTAASKYTGSSA